jgi:DNA-directed RNA polymerase specialized sigma24 family protein
VQFPTTHWSLLAKATLNGDSQGRRALEDLCRRYWSPAYQFIRSRGVPEPEAEDLAQDFMVHLIEKSTFTRADRLRGRFRSFLLGSLVRFLGDKADARKALKRGGGVEHVFFSEAQEVPGSGQAEVTADAGLVFDREWAVTVLEAALDRLREEFANAQRGEIFTTLKLFLPGATEPPTYETCAAQLGVSVSSLKSEIHRVRRRFRVLVRDEIAQTVSAPHEIESEMSHLQRVLMDRSHEYSDRKEPDAKPGQPNS